MTVSEFIRDIQTYYGAYPKGQLPYVVSYLKPKRETYLQSLFDLCIRKFSSKWGKAPDIAIFEELESEAMDREDKKRLKPNGFVQIADDEDSEDYVDPEEGLAYIDEMWNKIRNKRS